MNRSMLVALALVVVVTARAALASNTDTVVIANTAQNPGVISVAGTANIAGSVSINNTPSVNVANSPTVQVSSLPAVSIAANQSVSVASLPPVSFNGTQSVNVASMPSVNVATMPGITIANTPGSPAITRSADEHARQPFQREVYPFINDGSYYDVQTFQVPQGKRLVIEHVSASAGMPQGQFPNVVVGTISNGSYLSSYALMTKMGTVGSVPASDAYIGNAQVLAYADPESFVTIYLQRPYYADTASGNVGVSGYLIDP